MSDVTRILNAIEGGDVKATNELLPLVYKELRLLAAHKLSYERPDHMLQATALVHEAYIRLVEAECRNWHNRRHFFTAAAEAMRRILVENARRRISTKRGGGHRRVDFNEGKLENRHLSDDIIELDAALAKLTQDDPILSEVVQLRFFAGLTLEEVAEIRGVSRRTISSYWAYARAWLHREITGVDGSKSLEQF